jgi:hypothetical protein
MIIVVLPAVMDALYCLQECFDLTELVLVAWGDLGPYPEYRMWN